MKRSSITKPTKILEKPQNYSIPETNDRLLESKAFSTAKTSATQNLDSLSNQQIQNEVYLSRVSSVLLLSIYISFIAGSPFARPFLILQNKVDNSEGFYTKSSNDIYFFFLLFIKLMFFRSFVTSRLGRFLATSLGIKTAKTSLRFSEQLFGMIMATASFSFGLYLYIKYPQYLRLDTAWTSYPIIQMPYLMKVYYLYQSAFWSSALFYMFIEKKRSDFSEMILHHIVTISLLVGSYYYNYSAIGIIIHITMDFVDIFLPFTKMLKYLNYQLACNVSFVFMAITWVVSRHIVLLRIIYNIAFEANSLTSYRYDPENGFYATRSIQYIFLTFLVLLQILCYFWLYSMIIIIVSAINGKVIEDIRSEED
ncbi:Sphingosine N-acyltransferase lag1 [Smittium culicis]|uniref:Sphingosine N-acyltransferase lag1 n=1 Tax=Smittium culicis TaxID=133412 RepID=A0A1R1YPB3_9FUNG|nr:Sphingosine N-acyltransferase lag1 [Smittium culicis]